MHDQRWYIVQTEPQSEAKAADGLKLRGFDPYNPTFQRTVPKRGRMVDQARPLFPGYIFIATEAFEDVRKVPGCWDFLKVEGKPASLPQDAIDYVRAMEEQIEAERQWQIARRLQKAHDFEVGQVVRIVAGPFAHLSARVERLDGVNHLRLLLEMFGGPTPAVVTASEIEAA